MIGRLHHVALGVADPEEAAARWRTQFGLTVRRRGEDGVRLSCDDEPYCLELLAQEPPGLHHVGWELAAGCSLEQAAARFEQAAARSGQDTARSEQDTARSERPSSPLDQAQDDERSLWTADPDGNRLQLLPHREPASRLVSHARPAAGNLPGHPRRLGHVNFLTGALEEQLRFYTEVLGMRLTDWLGDGGVWLHTGRDHHVMALLDKGAPRFHHLALELVDVGQMRDVLDHLGRNGRWLGWGPVRHGIGGNIAAYVRIVEEACFVELYCDMEQLEEDHAPRRWPDDRHSSNTWGPLPPRSYFRFDHVAVESEREGLEALGVPLPPAPEPPEAK